MGVKNSAQSFKSTKFLWIYQKSLFLQYLNQLSGASFSSGFLIYFILLVGLAIHVYIRPNLELDQKLFWFLGLILILFSALRPLGAGIDAPGYTEMGRTICPLVDCHQLIQTSRDQIWFALSGALRSFFSWERSILLVSAIGVFVQLYCIDRLCRQKLLALTLYVSLVYFVFNITILRAGFALSWYFLAFYMFCSERNRIGTLLILTNFLVHTQALFSIALAPFYWLTENKRAAYAIFILCLVGIYSPFHPTSAQLSSLTPIPSAKIYIDTALSGGYVGVKPFPIAGFFMLGYLVLIISIQGVEPASTRLQRFVLASALMGTFFAWFFTSVHDIQMRLFDFYIAPLVFLAGNLKRNKYLFIATITLAVLLYIRYEVMHDYIIG